MTSFFSFGFAVRHSQATSALCVLVCAMSFFGAGCGASTSQLTGRWNLVSLKCNGVTTTLPGGMEGFIIEYRSDSTFTATFDGPGTDEVIVSGTINQSGLDVTENAASGTCSSACAFTTYCGSCPGTFSLSTSATYRVSLPTTDTLEQYGFNALSFCVGPTLPSQESQVYQRL